MPEPEPEVVVDVAGAVAAAAFSGRASGAAAVPMSRRGRCTPWEVLTVVRRGVMPVVSVDPMPILDGRSRRAACDELRAGAVDVSCGDVAAPLVRLWQVLDQECPGAVPSPFEDIDDHQFAADAGCLRSLGVTSGTTATTFSPEQPVTRAEAASLAGTGCGGCNPAVTAQPEPGCGPFDDVAADSVHRATSILCLLGLGIDLRHQRLDLLARAQPVTRAQFATDARAGSTSSSTGPPNSKSTRARA